MQLIYLPIADLVCSLCLFMSIFLVLNIDLIAILPSFISFVCPVIWEGEGGVAKKRYPAYKRDWLVILMLNNFNKKQRATTL
ncbi:TPA: hypothetical protein ACSI7Y_004726, partial [Klebsiella pneumoniae]